MAVKKSAIIPYRMGKNGLEIMLITRSSSDRWVIPKGKVDAPLKPHVSATKEAFEEAGVLGRTHPIRVGNFYDNSSNEPIPTFLLEVDIVLEEKDWLEKNKRSRLWIEADDCDDYIKDDDLLAVLRRGIRCLRSNGEYFKRAMKTFCEDHHLELSEVDEDYCELEFVMPSRRKKSLHLTRFDSTVEFSVPSSTLFHMEEDVRGRFSTTLLQRNAQKKIGFWCIDRMQGKLVYSYMHNAELHLLDSQQFFNIVSGLVAESEAIDELMAEGSMRQAASDISDKGD